MLTGFTAISQVNLDSHLLVPNMSILGVLLLISSEARVTKDLGDLRSS